MNKCNLNDLFRDVTAKRTGQNVVMKQVQHGISRLMGCVQNNFFREILGIF